MSRFDAPVSVGDVESVKIQTRGSEGDGIARVEQGFVLFVPGGVPGETVTVQVVDVKDSYAFGEVIDGA